MLFSTGDAFVEIIFGLVPLALFAGRQDPLEGFLLVVRHPRRIAPVGGRGGVLDRLHVLAVDCRSQTLGEVDVFRRERYGRMSTAAPGRQQSGEQPSVNEPRV